MPTVQVCVWAENAGVGVSQWAAESIGIWQDKGGLTTQWIDDKVRQPVWEIAQSVSIINKQGASTEQWDLLIDSCVTRISDLASKRPLWECYMSDNPNLHGQKLYATLDEVTEVGICRRKNRLEETPTNKSKLVQLGVHSFPPMLLLLLVMICRYRRRRGWKLSLPVLTYNGALRLLDRFPCRAI